MRCLTVTLSPVYHFPDLGCVICMPYWLPACLSARLLFIGPPPGQPLDGHRTPSQPNGVGKQIDSNKHSKGVRLCNYRSPIDRSYWLISRQIAWLISHSGPLHEENIQLKLFKPTHTPTCLRVEARMQLSSCVPNLFNWTAVFYQFQFDCGWLFKYNKWGISEVAWLAGCLRCFR